ncbi:methylamine utilization protein MauE (plasmid) [Paracoccus methylovorus]|uniref:Methylamine utilization protein MauE n=1 Tax=Paracoccus methylovorus TaxID=2812658 RepID=A0ABX7JUE8_9RHOB|nr:MULTISPECIES: MauE/DoxX family redox-associated membrane protein [Paracoccus]QRZ16242.1 methylamine utilization protein MauE [Paracoccus methylovorus]
MTALLQEPLILWTMRSFLAALFATAAISKLTGIEEFYGVVRNFRLLPDGLSRAVAMVLPVVELAVAVALLVPALALPAAVAAAVLMAVFGLAIAINVLRGRTQIDCGCFRNGMKQRISWLIVGRNAVLTGLALALVALHPGARPAGVVELTTGLIAGAVLMLLYLGASLLGGLTARQNATSTAKGR